MIWNPKKNPVALAFGEPNADGEWPYDVSERFSADELLAAADLRSSVTPAHDVVRRDRCPHTPVCPNVRVCVEEMAWYLRHRIEILERLEAV